MQVSDGTHALTVLTAGSPVCGHVREGLGISWLWRDTLATVSRLLWLLLIPLLGNALPTDLPPPSEPSVPLCTHSDEHGGEMRRHRPPPPEGTPRTRAASSPSRACRARHGGGGAPRATYVFTVDIGFTGAAEELSP